MPPHPFARRRMSANFTNFTLGKFRGGGGAQFAQLLGSYKGCRLQNVWLGKYKKNVFNSHTPVHLSPANCILLMRFMLQATQLYCIGSWTCHDIKVSTFNMAINLRKKSNMVFFPIVCVNFEERKLAETWGAKKSSSASFCDSKISRSYCTCITQQCHHHLAFTILLPSSPLKYIHN